MSYSDETRPLTVNLVSETVGGYTGHGVHTAYLQTLSALQGAGIDVRVNSSDACDIVHIQTMGLQSLWRLLRARERAVVTAHIVPDSLVGSFRLARFWLPIAHLYMRAFYSLADEVLAVSPDVLDGLRRMRLDVPARVVSNAIDTTKFVPQPEWRSRIRERLGIADDAFMVLCAGQIQPRKGVETFIDVARSMPDVTFVWVGGMPFRRLTDHYRHMLSIVKHAPANCHFVGDVPYDEMATWYGSADCLLFPSNQETFGLAIVEAAAAGLPLVLRDIHTYRALFGDAYLRGGEHDFAPLVAALRDDPTMRADYAQRSRDLAEKFDTSRLAERLNTVYADVLNRSEEERARAARRVRPVFTWAFGGKSGSR